MDAAELLDALDELTSGMPPRALCEGPLRLVRDDLTRAAGRLRAELGRLALDRDAWEAEWSLRAAELLAEQEATRQMRLREARLLAECETRVA
jgi:hypothetical protein